MLLEKELRSSRVRRKGRGGKWGKGEGEEGRGEMNESTHAQVRLGTAYNLLLGRYSQRDHMFKDSLVFRESSRPARTTQQDPASKKANI